MTPSDVKYIIVHCSATRPNQDIGFAEINEWHKKNGWRSPSGISCGYHYIVRRDGAVEKGRPENETGAHAKGWNHCSISICMVGGVDKDLTPEANYTDVQWESLLNLRAELLGRYPDADWLGHCDLPKVTKACPCFDVREFLSGDSDLKQNAGPKPCHPDREVDILPPEIPAWMRGE